MNKRRWLALAALLGLALATLLLSGCGSETRTDGQGTREQVSESHTTTKEVTVHTPTADGGFIVEKTTTSDTTAGERSTTASRESIRTAPDAATNALIGSGARIAGAVMNKATGGLLPGGTGTAISALITAAITAWGARRAGEARQLREERDFHKDDAEKGWSKFEAAQEARGKT